jgi:hypothetical protein
MKKTSVAYTNALRYFQEPWSSLIPSRARLLQHNNAVTQAIMPLDMTLNDAYLRKLHC